MNWVMTLAMLLQQEPLSLENLSTALFARGMYAYEALGTLAEDARLRELEGEFLRTAALHPGREVLVLRLEQAEQTLQDVDDGLAFQAERALADVLNTRDLWSVRALGLRALKLDGIAGAVEQEVAWLDGLLRNREESLGALSWMREEALGSAWNPEATVWRLVPPLVEAEPQAHPGLGPAPAPSDEELLRVGQGIADATLERRVLQALEQDEGLRQHYEELLEDFEAFQAAPRNIVHLQVHKHLQHVPQARRIEEPRAAAATRSDRYETPGIDALVYQFQDGSELYVQRETADWVLFLARTQPGAHDEFLGPVVERITHRQLLIAVTRPGEVQVRYGGMLVQLSLEPLKA
jgi:hypothetical protein